MVDHGTSLTAKTPQQADLDIDLKPLVVPKTHASDASFKSSNFPNMSMLFLEKFLKIYMSYGFAQVQIHTYMYHHLSCQ